METSWTIGQLAEAAGVNLQTLRYYEREGLLPAPERQANGYRRYRTTHRDRLAFILRAKRLGFTLPEIRELLALSARDESSADQYHAIVEEKLADIHERIAALQSFERALQGLLDACPQAGPQHQCPIHNTLIGKKSLPQA